MNLHGGTDAVKESCMYACIHAVVDCLHSLMPSFSSLIRHGHKTRAGRQAAGRKGRKEEREGRKEGRKEANVRGWMNWRGKEKDRETQENAPLLGRKEMIETNEWLSN